MRKFKYVIVSTKLNNGGAIALHALCKNLSELGEDAKIFYYNKGCNEKNRLSTWLYTTAVVIKDILQSIFVFKKDENNKIYIKRKLDYLPECRRKFFPFVGKNTIVLYPEIITGNFLNAEKVTRWLLFHNKLFSQDGDKTIGYDKNDLFFCYREVFNDEKLNPECRKLSITYFDFDTYKSYNHGQRSGKCYIIRKGRNRSDLPSEFDGPVIDDLPESEKVKYFNSCEYCVSYDTQTAYSQLAALCGCISIVMPEEGKARDDYRKNTGSVFDTGYGEAFGFAEDEIEYAKSSYSKLVEEIKKTEQNSIDNTKHFVEECEKYFDRM